MNADEVLGANQTGVVEVAGFEKKRVESFQASVFRIVVSADNSGFQSKPRLPQGVPRVTGISRRRPCQDGVAAEGAHLKDLLRIPIPAAACAEFPSAQGVPM